MLLEVLNGAKVNGFIITFLLSTYCVLGLITKSKSMKPSASFFNNLVR